MGVPKRRTSKMKIRHRKAANSRCTELNLSKCSSCGSPILFHRVCTSCGKYREKQILIVKND